MLLQVLRSKEEADKLNDALAGSQRDFEQARREVDQLRSQLATAHKQAEGAESALSYKRMDNRRRIRVSRSNSRGEVDTDRPVWLEELPLPCNGCSRPVSPLPPFSQGTSIDVPFSWGETRPRQGVSGSFASNGIADVFSRARNSGGQPQSNLSGPLEDDDGGCMNFAPFDQALETLASPSSPTADYGDDLLAGTKAPSVGHQNLPDMISVSTTGAGPSVQLVERMSAAIRRLEAEKVATREDLSRVSSQRDEARREVSSLMKEVGSRAEAYRRASDLESQVTEINSRYQTTLEMLGEKSELVEELRADVHDVKTMYRELIESTTK